MSGSERPSPPALRSLRRLSWLREVAATKQEDAAVAWRSGVTTPVDRSPSNNGDGFGDSFLGRSEWGNCRPRKAGRKWW